VCVPEDKQQSVCVPEDKENGSAPEDKQQCVCVPEDKQQSVCVPEDKENGSAPEDKQQTDRGTVPEDKQQSETTEKDEELADKKEHPEHPNSTATETMPQNGAEKEAGVAEEEAGVAAAEGVGANNDAGRRDGKDMGSAEGPSEHTEPKGSDAAGEGSMDIDADEVAARGLQGAAGEAAGTEDGGGGRQMSSGQRTVVAEAEGSVAFRNGCPADEAATQLQLEVAPQLQLEADPEAAQHACSRPCDSHLPARQKRRRILEPAGAPFEEQNAFLREEHMADLDHLCLWDVGPPAGADAEGQAEPHAQPGALSTESASMQSLQHGVAQVMANRGVEALTEDALAVLSEVVAARILRACTLLKEKMETGRMGSSMSCLMDCMRLAGMSGNPVRLAAAMSLGELDETRR